MVVSAEKHLHQGDDAAKYVEASRLAEGLSPTSSGTGFFIGEVRYKGEILPGERPAILDKALFEAVQQKLSAHQSHKTLTRRCPPCLLLPASRAIAVHAMGW